MADISQICIARILNVMEQCGKKAISDKALYGKVKGKKVTLPDYKKPFHGSKSVEISLR